MHQWDAYHISLLNSRAKRDLDDDGFRSRLHQPFLHVATARTISCCAGLKNQTRTRKECSIYMILYTINIVHPRGMASVLLCPRYGLPPATLLAVFELTTRTSLRLRSNELSLFAPPMTLFVPSRAKVFHSSLPSPKSCMTTRSSRPSETSRLPSSSMHTLPTHTL